jgi:hypothetical protein
MPVKDEKDKKPQSKRVSFSSMANAAREAAAAASRAAGSIPKGAKATGSGKRLETSETSATSAPTGGGILRRRSSLFKTDPEAARVIKLPDLKPQTIANVSADVRRAAQKAVHDEFEQVLLNFPYFFFERGREITSVKVDQDTNEVRAEIVYDRLWNTKMTPSRKNIIGTTDKGVEEVFSDNELRHNLYWLAAILESQARFDPRYKTDAAAQTAKDQSADFLGLIAFILNKPNQAKPENKTAEDKVKLVEWEWRSKYNEAINNLGELVLSKIKIEANAAPEQIQKEISRVMQTAEIKRLLFQIVGSAITNIFTDFSADKLVYNIRGVGEQGIQNMLKQAVEAHGRTDVAQGQKEQQETAKRRHSTGTPINATKGRPRRNTR